MIDCLLLLSVYSCTESSICILGTCTFSASWAILDTKNALMFICNERTLKCLKYG